MCFVSILYTESYKYSTGRYVEEIETSKHAYDKNNTTQMRNKLNIYNNPVYQVFQLVVLRFRSAMFVV